MAKVFVLLPVFNRLEYTKRCLRSVFRQTYSNFQVILVDSASSDGTVAYVAKHWPQVIIIQGTPQWWWTKAIVEAVDLSLRLAKKSDYVLLLNNDCFLKAGYLHQILSTARKYPKAIIGSLCVRDDRPSQVVEAGIRIDWPSGLVYGVAQTISNKLGYFRKMEVVNQLDALPGKGTLIPIRVFQQIGNFDLKRLPHYIADYEFANRAKRAGWKLLVDTHAVVKHHFEATGDFSRQQWEKRSYRRAWNLLFGRKSMNNVVDWINFLLVACPRRYLPINLYYAFWRVVNGVLSVWPLYYLRPMLHPLLQFIAKMYHTTKFLTYRTKLLAYRIYLYITQFLTYHLRNWKYITWLKIVQFPDVYLRQRKK